MSCVAGVAYPRKAVRGAVRRAAASAGRNARAADMLGIVRTVCLCDDGAQSRLRGDGLRMWRVRFQLFAVGRRGPKVRASSFLPRRKLVRFGRSGYGKLEVTTLKNRSTPWKVLLSLLLGYHYHNSYVSFYGHHTGAQHIMMII